MDVLSLLDSKKRCLRRLLSESESFLASARAGDFAGLEGFERARDAIIKAVGMYDRKLTDVVRGLPLEKRTPALAEAVGTRLDDEAAVIRDILALDDRVMEALAREQARIKQEIAASNKAKEIAGRFKSGWMPESGEGLDTKL